MKRNKTLLIFYLFLASQSFLFAKSDSVRISPKSVIDKLHTETPKDQITEIEKVFKSVPVDTTDRKVVTLNPNFRKKYLSDNDFNYKQEDVSKSFFVRLLEKINELLKKLLGLNSLNKAASVTLWSIRILCVLIILVVIYFIVRVYMNHKGTWFFQKKNDSVVIDINNTEQLIQSADFEQLISEIEKQGNTRQSIRLYYLWLLKNLKDKELIVWLPEKTNADYLAELRDETLRKQFAYLSYLYNNIWYGEFSITDVEYLAARKAFLTHLRKENKDG
jgi:hypothetical protein